MTTKEIEAAYVGLTVKDVSIDRAAGMIFIDFDDGSGMEIKAEGYEGTSLSIVCNVMVEEKIRLI